MSGDLNHVVLLFVLIFCRVGTCIMLLPGYSSDRVTPRIRLLIAGAATLSLLPMIDPGQNIPDSPAALGRVMVGEISTGGLLGLLVRVAFDALHFISTMAAQSLGFAGLPGASLENGESATAFVSLITATATVALFLADLHITMLIALLNSYSIVPPMQVVSAATMMESLTNRLSETLLIILRLGSPFLALSILINFGVALMSRAAPAISSYFIAQPIVIVVGLLLMLLVVSPFFEGFNQALTVWIEEK